MLSAFLTKVSESTEFVRADIAEAETKRSIEKFAQKIHDAIPAFGITQNSTRDSPYARCTALTSGQVWDIIVQQLKDYK